MSGCDELTEETEISNMYVLCGKVISTINFKMGILLLVICIIILSDIFIRTVLSKIDGCVDGACATTKGSLIQIGVIVTSFLGLDFLDSVGVI